MRLSAFSFLCAIILLVLSCGPPPYDLVSIEARYTGSALISNPSVGNEWSTEAEINDEPATIDTIVEIPAGEDVILKARATGYDDANDDTGLKIYSVDKSDLTTEWSEILLEVNVQEDAGRYVGNIATWEYTFDVRLAEEQPVDV